MTKNEELFHEIYEKRHSTMILYCIGRGISEQNAEDYVQILFELVWKRIALFASLDKNQQRKWMYSAINNIISNKNKYNNEIPYDSLENDLRLSSRHIDFIIEEEQFQNYITEIKKQLNESETALFKAVFEDKLSYKELSETYKKNQFALRSQVSRLRKKIEPIIKNTILKE